MNKEKWPVALLINDIHVSKDNISDFQLNWDEALNLCKKHKIPEIVVGGDLWQSRSAQTLPVLMAVRQAILKATNDSIEVVIAEGNHDLIDQESYLGYSHIFSHYSLVDVIDDYTIEDITEDVTFAVMSYFPENGGFVNHLNELRSQIEPQNTILYIHEGIRGALAQSTDKELPAHIFEDFQKVLVGHYHDRCKVGKNIEYIGASRQHNFGEDEEKGYTILYSDGSTEFVKNEVNTRYSTLVVTSDNIEAAKDKIQQLKKEGKKVRVQVACDSNEAAVVDKKALVELGATKVEIKTESTNIESASQTLETKYDKTGIKQEYTTFCEKKEISDVETGLKYLDKIN